MKTYIKSAFVAIIAMVLFASNSFAASDYLLELEGVKGESKGKKLQLTENSDGSFTIENIPAGTYNVVYKAKQGKTGSTKRSTGAGGGPHVLAFEYNVKAPRDVATGQASGKRQHKPITISKEWDANTPMLILGQILVGDLDGDGVIDTPPTTDGAADSQGDGVHGVIVKRGVDSKSDVQKAGYDVALNKKV